MLAPAVLAVAAAIAGHPVDITCHERADMDRIAVGYGYNPNRVSALGEVGGTRIWLREHTCRRLNAVGTVPTKFRSRVWNQAGAVQTLGHELGHIRGIVNERDAECFGWRVSKRVALTLGHKRPYQLRRVARRLATNSEGGTSCF